MVVGMVLPFPPKWSDSALWCPTAGCCFDFQTDGVRGALYKTKENSSLIQTITVQINLIDRLVCNFVPVF